MTVTHPTGPPRASELAATAPTARAAPKKSLGRGRASRVLFFRYAYADGEEKTMDYRDLTEEQRAKVAGAHTPEDILRLAREEGYELDDEELEQVAGGFFGDWAPYKCPKCGGPLFNVRGTLFCRNCGYQREQD